MSEKLEFIARDIPFEYEERDITDGIARTQRKFDGFKRDLGKAGVDQEYTARVVARYGRALDYTKKHRPDEIIQTLQGLHSQIAQLESEGKNRLDIARKIETENPGLIVILRDILHKGWIEPLFQSAVAASYK